MSTSTTESPTPVAIIGAGLAGLATAARLRTLGIHSIIYEAQHRPGGRVQTAQTSHGANLDLGATWFHGTVGNVALDLAVSSGALPAPPPPLPEHASKEHKVSNEYGCLVFATPGIHVLPSGEVRRLEPAVSERIVRAYATQLCSMESFPRAEAAPVVSVLEIMKKATGFGRMNALERGLFKARDLIECTVNGCDGSTETLSANRLDDYVVLPGDNVLAGEGGMSAVVRALLRNLEDGQVVLGAEVTCVKWGKAAVKPGVEKVEIGFRDGASAHAECVVWTGSLNVTKKAVCDGVFEPGLPAGKVEAMQGRGQGLVDKVFAVVGRALTGVVANCAIPVVWEQEVTDEQRALKRVEWQKSVYAVTYDDKHRTVSFWLCGEGAMRFEEVGERDKVEEVSKMLSHLLQQEVVVEEVINSCWGVNEFVRGSYSYPRVECGKEDVKEMERPLPCVETPVLCFAGEATHDTFYSTMHGAIESGYREAERCAKFLTREH